MQKSRALKFRQIGKGFGGMLAGKKWWKFDRLAGQREIFGKGDEKLAGGGGAFSRFVIAIVACYALFCPQL